jgi:hypothetical protein
VPVGRTLLSAAFDFAFDFAFDLGLISDACTTVEERRFSAAEGVSNNTGFSPVFVSCVHRDFPLR